MITYDVKKSLIYKELDLENIDYWFDRYTKQFTHNIDTFYYTVFIKSYYNEDLGIKSLHCYLEEMKNKSLDSFEDIRLEELSEDLYTTGLGFGMYAYSIEKKDKYIIFLSRKKPSDETPEILIQIRSQFLWLVGEHQAIEESFLDLKNILEKYNVEIERTQENRIDYAYHTNYIQDPLNFFKEENLNKMQVSRFTRWHKEGRFVGEDIVECDYISFGRRKSNNTFLRIYNKSQEVVNQQYKQFFIKIWLDNKMINKYDYYILEKCFIHGSYNFVDRARLEFYLENGKDKEIKKEIYKVLKSNNTMKIKNLADELVPKLTIIVNIELQTKRKFYHTMDKSLNLLKTVTCKYMELEKIFKILDNKDLIHDYLTTHVIRFVDRNTHTRKSNCYTSSWWQILQNVKLNNAITDTNRKLIREYQKNLDIEKLKKRTLNSLGTLSIYMKNENSDNLATDLVDFMSYLNESDLESISKYKKKKSAMLRNQLQNLSSLAIDKSFVIIDSETAEILSN